MFSVKRVVIKNTLFYPESFIPGTIQGQIRRGSEQPDLAEDTPAHCRGVALDDL